MRKITVEGIEINFNDLTKQKQKELYEKNKEKYKEDASESIYSVIRIKIAKEENESSDFLNRMLQKEINGENNRDVMYTVFNNKIFKIKEETIRCLATSDNWQNRQKAAELSKDSKFLNQMLRDEINGENDGDIIDEILDNGFFEIEEETIECLAKSDDWTNRRKAAELSKDSKFLNRMLRDEINGINDEDVMNEILNNEFFKIEEETIECYAESNAWQYRLKAAELSKNPKLLNQMLENEINGESDGDVIDAIFDNDVFEIEDAILELLKTSKNAKNRKIAAKLLKDSDSLLEMFINELKNYKNVWFSDVMETIIENEAFTIEKTKLLEYIRDNY